jgi:type I restriction enzyme M protein
VDAEKMGGKKDILDSRFNAYLESGEQLTMIPRSSDGQLLFLLNNVSKMKKDTALGSRIAEVHNGSSLFTGDAGSGESNARRYLIESDLVEAIIALPEKMFYNTGIGTFIWILSNRKEDRRKGKIQLIDATQMKSPLRKNMGEKNCELTPEIRAEIVRILMEMEESEVSRVFPNEEFGYWKVSVLQPLLDEHGRPQRDKKGKLIPDKDRTDSEIIPFTYEGGIDAFMEREVRPYAPDAWVDEKKTQIGYELSFTKYFYKPVELRPLAEIIADLRALEKETDGMMAEILGGLEG